MLFGWFKRRRRRQLLENPFPETWLSLLRSDFTVWDQLTDAEQNFLKDAIQIFVAEKNWEGCGGLQMTEQVKVLVAAQAMMLSLGYAEPILFDHVLSVLVYPDAYRAPGDQQTHQWIVSEGSNPRMGEAWWRGPVILSWRHTLAGARGQTDGENLVLHEFAHQLDMMNGRIVDGTPPIDEPDEFDRWVETMTRSYNGLVRRCRRREPGILSSYGTTNAGEFFAVATETFFSAPRELYDEDADLYELLRDYFRQDPAARN